MIKQRFLEIKKCQIPELYKSYKCKCFCWHGKNTFEGTNIKPIQEFRNGQVCKRGETMTICEQCKYEIEKKGLTKVVEEYQNPEHSIGFYQEPGGPK